MNNCIWINQYENKSLESLYRLLVQTNNIEKHNMINHGTDIERFVNAHD